MRFRPFQPPYGRERRRAGLCITAFRHKHGHAVIDAHLYASQQCVAAVVARQPVKHNRTPPFSTASQIIGLYQSTPSPSSRMLPRPQFR
jgi:hypothetical protein